MACCHPLCGFGSYSSNTETFIAEEPQEHPPSSGYFSNPNSRDL